jgi:hypothetical protein
MTVLLDLSIDGELQSYIDLPERLGCPASGRNRQHPVGRELSVRDRLHPLPEIHLFGVDYDAWTVTIGDE